VYVGVQWIVMNGAADIGRVQGEAGHYVGTLL